MPPGAAGTAAPATFNRAPRARFPFQGYTGVPTTVHSPSPNRLLVSAMNLNDPFGRLEARQAKDYQSLRKALKEAGVDSREAAQRLHDRLGRRCRLSIAILLPVTLLLALLFPQAQVVFIALGGLGVLWVVNATRRGRMHLERYIAEEFDDDRGPP